MKGEKQMEKFINQSPLFLVIICLIIGFAFLMKGADYFVEGSSSVAKRLKVPSIIIGLTIVAMGTSLPETAVSVSASLTCNNIASLYVAREHLENAFILDGDQIIYHPEILAPEFERSGYNSVWTDDETDEWLQTVENGIVTGCSRTGGKGGWQLYSISRWTAEDGKRLKGHLEQEFEVKKNRQIYWDDVAMFCYPKEYQLGIRPMKAEDIIEVDNFSELVALDASYADYAEREENEQ